MKEGCGDAALLLIAGRDERRRVTTHVQTSGDAWESRASARIWVLTRPNQVAHSWLRPKPDTRVRPWSRSTWRGKSRSFANTEPRLNLRCAAGANAANVLRSRGG